MRALPCLFTALVACACAPAPPLTLEPDASDYRTLDTERSEATVAPGETFAFRLGVPAAIQDSYSLSEPVVMGRGAALRRRVQLPNTRDGELVMGGRNTDLFLFEAADRVAATITIHHVWDHRPQRRRALRMRVTVEPAPDRVARHSHLMPCASGRAPEPSPCWSDGACRPSRVGARLAAAARVLLAPERAADLSARRAVVTLAMPQSEPSGPRSAPSQ